MGENLKDTKRALLAAKAIFDNRDPSEKRSAILVTTEHAFAAVLLTIFDGDSRKAVAMLNEGLVPGIEDRLAYYASKGKR